MYRDNAFVKRAGKEKTAELATNKFISACQAVLIMDITISRLDPAFVIVIGLGMIAHKLSAVWIADRMEFASRQGADAILVGMELCVNS